jgi:hypothetical protein
MTGLLTFVPVRAVQMASKSLSSGEDELQMGMRLWTYGVANQMKLYHTCETKKNKVLNMNVIKG